MQRAQVRVLVPALTILHLTSIVMDVMRVAPESLKASPRAQRRMVGSIPTDSLAKALVPFCPPESSSVVPGHDHELMVAIGAPLHRVIPGHRDDLAAFVQRADALRVIVAQHPARAALQRLCQRRVIKAAVCASVVTVHVVCFDVVGRAKKQELVLRHIVHEGLEISALEPNVFQARIGQLG